MGGSHSKRRTPEEEQAVQLLLRRPLPPPSYSDQLWVASCRQVSSMRAFAPHLLLFRPDCRLFCPSGK